MDESLLEGILEDRNGDGIIDYLNACIYVADDATAQELAAASNVAARLAFETISLDLPLAFRIGSLRAREARHAIVVGRAANRWTSGASGVLRTREGRKTILAIESPEEANAWAASIWMGDSAADHAAFDSEPPSAGFTPSLSELFTERGLGGVSRVSLSLGSRVGAVEVIDLAARIALETTRLHLPLAVAGDCENSDAFEVLIGRSHAGIERLQDSGLARVDDLDRHEGRVEIIPDPDHKRSSLVILGSDAPGEAAALACASRRLPFIGEYGMGHTDLRSVENELVRFVSGRSGEGQLAAGLAWARKRLAESGQEAEITIDVAGVAGEASIDGTRVSVRDHAFGASQTIFEDEFTTEWEVERARAVIHDRLFPELEAGMAIDLEVRLSEPLEVRQDLEQGLTDELIRRGTDPSNTRVCILSAHKQAYSWITEVLSRDLAGTSSVTIYVREPVRKSENDVDSSNRWLEELYPVDDVLAQSLGIRTGDTRFERVSSGPTYRIVAQTADGGVSVDEAFEPTFEERPLFRAYPDYASVRVSTGWIRAKLDGRTCLSERIPTDPESFWDEFERRGLARLRDYLLTLYDGCPDPGRAPHFGLFDVEVSMSEPDGGIGIGQERISTVEALHEDIYFQTLLFIDLVGTRSTGTPLPHPGRIIPRVTSAPGRKPRARLRLTGKCVPGPAVRLEAVGAASDGTSRVHSLSPDATARVAVTGVIVREGLRDMALEASVRGCDPEFIERIRCFDEMRQSGVASDRLAYPDIDRIRFHLENPGHSGDRVSLATLGRPSGRPMSDPVPPPHAGGAIVPSDVPLDSKSAEGVIRKLASFPEVRAFVAGDSFLGRPIWALEVTAPVSGRYVSTARSSVTKPTLFITGRQHGNEVSSTSHILRLVETLVSGPERALLARCNLIVLPMTNPDGADLAHELAGTTPDFMLHAGYYGCLGTDVIEAQWNEHSLYPESRIRRDLWEKFKPDVVLDPHGYPSHEWVQLFAGYAGWFRSRDRIRRDWWIPRGAFLPAFRFVDDPRYPHHPSTARAIRSAITQALSRTLGQTNTTMYQRYLKYAAPTGAPSDWEVHDGVLVCSVPKPAPGDLQRKTFMDRDPGITVFETVIELPDETARGPWLAKLNAAGLEASLACIRFLAGSRYQLRRTRSLHDGGVWLGIERPRPVRPATPS